MNFYILPFLRCCCKKKFSQNHEAFVRDLGIKLSIAFFYRNINDNINFPIFILESQDIAR